jgi:hypothetical protein
MGVWLDGENGGVTPPGTSREVAAFASAVGAESEGAGEGGRAPAGGCAAVTVAKGSAEGAVLAAEVSIVVVSVLEEETGRVCANIFLLRTASRKPSMPELEAKGAVSIA